MHRAPSHVHRVSCTVLTPHGPFKYTPTTGTRARGHTYERAVERHVSPLVASLGWTLFSHWWLFDGRAWVQPDFIIRTPACAFILEAKLTWTECCNQLAKYVRAAQTEFDCPVWGAVVCRNLTPTAPRILCTDFLDLEPNSTWHLLL